MPIIAHCESNASLCLPGRLAEAIFAAYEGDIRLPTGLPFVRTNGPRQQIGGRPLLSLQRRRYP